MAEALPGAELNQARTTEPVHSDRAPMLQQDQIKVAMAKYHEALQCAPGWPALKYALTARRFGS